MIKLTNRQGKAIYVHRMAIFYIEPHDQGSTIHLMALGTPAKALVVKETPDEIAGKL